MDQEIQEVQQRLLEKRKVTESPIPLKSIDFQEIGNRCAAMARERAERRPLPTGNTGEIVYYRFTMTDFRIPSRYRECAFDNFQGNDKLVDRIRTAMGRDESLVLIGNTGCGKTHLAIAAMRYLVDAERIGAGSTFIPVPELLLKIRATFREGAGETEEEVIDRYSKCRFLILDDLGAEKTTEFSIATLELIINRRVMEDKQTIITTNLSLDEIEGKLSARIASRLSEMNCVKITMPDYRKRVRKT
jgi:DNA replication protein DnaC